MLRRIFFPVLMGVVGCGILITLCVWQLQRLDWKRGLLGEIETRIAAEPVALPLTPTEANDEYLAVRLSGTPLGREVHVLSSGTGAGTGYRVISAFRTDDGRDVMVDQGVMPLTAKQDAPALAPVELTGNLVWPDDKTDSTPPPDLAKNIWFARDVAPMAAELGTEPLLVVLSAATGYDPRVVPVPVDTGGIKNDHREYAITWGLLALVWAAMSIVFITRSAAKKD